MTTWTLVTGGAKRLGAAICLALAAKGHNIAVHYRQSEQEALSVAEACRKHGVLAEIIQGDFSTTETTEAFAKNYLQQFKETQNLINNVGNFLVRTATKTTQEQWLDLFQNNLNAPFLLINACLPSIKKHHGAIINLGVAGIQEVNADIYSTAYSCAKTGLWMLTKSLAKELASSHVRVNMVSPGYLDISVDLPDDVCTLPMGRAAAPQEAADVIAFLLDPSASYITGQNIEVAGGIRL
jgi:NAD(P)-dependent dehydrogenase (short-subunit alcohol dehydrogenase family)